MRSHFIYQDESGIVGTTGNFVVGLLFVKDRKPLYEIINKVRQKHDYWKEFHFKEIFYSSSKRSRVACEVLDEILRQHIYFRALAVSNEKLELRYFDKDIGRVQELSEKQIKMAKSKGMFRAYNYFTKELILENADILNEAVVYLDKKIRMQDDNICEYLKREVNLSVKRGAIKKVEPRDSKMDDLIGIADLVLGALNYDLKQGKNPMKLAVVRVVKQYVGKKIRLREWVFK
ncbi:MAG: DUF3800 domain-containing protein [Candidatus Ratteibacteria bacterium]|nr:DUF3800 domain-containing protein [Candidatus Ratteibacteria bacterium]